MRRTATIMAGLLFAAGLLGGCGDGDGGSSSAGGDYCDTLKSAAKDIKSFTADNATPDFAAFDTFLDKAKDLADEAPAAIEDDWDVLLGAMDELTSALDDAGIDLEELMKAVTQNEMPEGVDMSKLADLGTKLQNLSGEKMEKASDAINKHAKDECDVDLSKS